MAAYESDLDFYQTSYTFEEIEAREAFRENCIARKLYEQVKMSCKGIVDDMSFEIMRRCGVKPFFPKKRKTFTFEDGSQIPGWREDTGRGSNLPNEGITLLQLTI